MTNGQTLPLPNPKDWATRSAAARELGCSERTVDRLADAGTLQPYTPRVGGEYRPPVLFWWPQVQEVARARQLLARP